MTNGDTCNVCRKFYPHTGSEIWKCDAEKIILPTNSVVFAVMRLNKPDEFEACEVCYETGRLESILSEELMCEAHYEFGCEFSRHGQFDKAKSALKKSLKIKESADCLAALGYAEEYLGNKGEAMNLYRRALLIKPEHFMAKENLETLLREN